MAINEKKIKAEEGKLKKIFSAIKKALSKELLWVLLIALISIPFALICSYILNRSGWECELEIFEILAGEKPTFLVMYVICAIGIYFSRIVATAIKTQLAAIKKVKDAG